MRYEAAYDAKGELSSVTVTLPGGTRVQVDDMSRADVAGRVTIVSDYARLVAEPMSRGTMGSGLSVEVQPYVVNATEAMPEPERKRR